MSTTTLQPPAQLPLPTTSYIRKLLAQCDHELISVMSKGKDAILDVSADLTQVVTNLYPNETHAPQVLTELQQLVYLHRGICRDLRSELYARHELYQIETQIFGLLGLQRLCVA